LVIVRTAIGVLVAFAVLLVIALLLDPFGPVGLGLVQVYR
jgi:hypothetical protein